MLAPSKAAMLGEASALSLGDVVWLDQAGTSRLVVILREPYEAGGGLWTVRDMASGQETLAMTENLRPKISDLEAHPEVEPEDQR